eukprot:CAMPEP_0118947902 /NCGR_PEP_ID=MMETSP1169-20130426/46865_1 /TAXON_ID=36882 /ORGANISM="Pyramimonas obovata, Strain CCMP722" /LENGTH=330 /DNA_ID=CAMNT_0006894211 /DNA_START=30 /DNA_END=1019 /DNA_ORIENTATION=+
MMLVSFLVLTSLHYSSSRWRDLQEELERREAQHAVELDKQEQALAKARQGTIKCSASEKETLDKIQTRTQAKVQKVEAQLRIATESLTKAEKRIKELEREEAGKGRENAKLEDKVSKYESSIQTKEEELQEIKQESIDALKASRERAGVLRRGLQGSAALLAEKNVLIEQLNMTLFAALYHMEKDQREAAAERTHQLSMPLKDRKATVARLVSKDVNLEQEFDNAVLVYQAARKEHARLAQEFVNATRAEKERLDKEKEKAALLAQTQKQKVDLSALVIGEAAKVAKTEAADSPETPTRRDSKADAKEKDKGRSAKRGAPERKPRPPPKA